jgi:hypothetical protein
METLWEDLSRSDEEFESPAWHAQELAATEQGLAKGKEQILEAKRASEEVQGD